MVPDQSHEIVIEYIKCKLNFPAKVVCKINDACANCVVDKHASGFALDRR